MKFGTDGVRGVANVDLTPAFALDLGRAAARVLGGRAAVVGGDTRVSTAMLAAAFAAGLASEGHEVHQLGVVPTPAVAFEAARRDAIGAVISASHNPYHDNGIKLFAQGGTKLSDELERQIEDELRALPAPAGDPGPLLDVEPSPAYVEHLWSVLEGRRLDGLHIVVDAANGAASALAEAVFADVGAKVTVINATPDGRNINDHCGATHLDPLSTAVVAIGADLGLALDGDADRLLAVDHNGVPVDGDHILVLTALDQRRRGLLARDTVVTTVLANLGLRVALETAGVAVVQTAVGDRYVLEAIDANGFSLGGEQSGHVIFRSHASTGDGLLTGLVLADLVARAGAPLAELAGAAMTRYPQVMINIRVAERVADPAAALADEIAAAERALADAGRVLVRASGTEPLVRVMVEALDDAIAITTAESLAAAVRHRWS